ncbi:MAG: lipid-binding SYLF domain-containing protein [Geminicoccaceae bacterium]|nr:lipid-binding SYLF domain-containing protein [Geminicoccaceae bacterium]MDW8340888.1 lipid-binding SYLF domain-containing protein [Geminicoccaceae bacterium]
MPLPTRRLFLSALLLSSLAWMAPARAGSEQQRLVDRARIVVEEFLADPEFQRMRVYVQNAYAVIVVPDLLKAGFFLGAEYGKGVLLARDVRSGAWSDPIFVELYGGSIGLQFGGKASDVILTVMNRAALDKILTSNFKIGTDASVAAGPVGAGVGAATTLQFGEDLYVFSRGKGLYGGLSVEGTAIVVKGDWNNRYYGQSVTPAAVLDERRVTNTGSQALRDALARF